MQYYLVKEGRGWCKKLPQSTQALCHPLAWILLESEAIRALFTQQRLAVAVLTQLKGPGLAVISVCRRVSVSPCDWCYWSPSQSLAAKFLDSKTTATQSLPKNGKNGRVEIAYNLHVLWSWKKFHQIPKPQGKYVIAPSIKKSFGVF